MACQKLPWIRLQACSPGSCSIIEAGHTWQCRGLENELAKLIQDNQIQARIDSNAKILHARHTNVRSQTFQAALQAGMAMLLASRAIAACCRAPKYQGPEVYASQERFCGACSVLTACDGHCVAYCAALGGLQTLCLVANLSLIKKQGSLNATSRHFKQVNLVMLIRM